jgi:serine/threonine protein kinase
MVSLAYLEQCPSAPYAVKQIKLQTPAVYARLQQEIQVMQLLQQAASHHFVRLYSATESCNFVYLRMELCTCDLRTYLDARGALG